MKRITTLVAISLGALVTGSAVAGDEWFEQQRAISDGQSTTTMAVQGAAGRSGDSGYDAWFEQQRKISDGYAVNTYNPDARGTLGRKGGDMDKKSDDFFEKQRAITD